MTPRRRRLGTAGIGGTLFRAGSVVVPAAFLVVFLLYPLARIFIMGFSPAATRGAPLTSVMADSNLAKVLPASAGQAFLSTGLALLVGLPAAYVFGRFDFRGKGLLRVLLSIPFVLPTVVVCAAFVELIGARGLVPRALSALGIAGSAGDGYTRTLGAVVAAHVFYNAGIVIRIVGSAWTSLDPRLAEAARTLGAGRPAAFLRISARLLLPAVAASALLVFVFCFSSFGVILVLGGPRMATLETEIYRQAVNMFNLPAAAFLSVVQLVATGLVMLAYSRIQARTGTPQASRPEAASLRRPRGSRERLLVLFFGVGIVVTLVIPMASLVVGSFLGSRGATLSSWAALFAGTGHSLFWASPLLAAANSLRFALEATLLALAMGIPASYAIARGQAGRPKSGSAGSAVLDVLFLLPLGTSAVTLGFGFIVAMNQRPFNLGATPFLIPIAHALVGLPLVIRSLLPALRSLNPRLGEAAATLGASPSTAWKTVDLPMLARSFGSAAAFAFTVSLGEFGATALLTRPELVTLPILVYGALTRPGELNQGQALAASTILMLVCGLGLSVIERFRTAAREMF